MRSWPRTRTSSSIPEAGSITPTIGRPGIAAIDAVYPAARNPMAFPALARSGLAAHRVRRVYLFWTTQPRAWVDVSATLSRKIAALAAHASQIHEPDKLAERITEWAAEDGARIGAAAAEDFRVVVIDEDDEGPAGGPETADAEAVESATEAAPNEG